MEGGAALVGIVLVSHGLLADGLKDAAEMILGPQERFLTIGMGHAADLDDLRSRIEAAVASVAGDSGALVLVDLMGGSPSNASGYLAHSGTQVICGVNLPMLLEVLTQREGTTVQELTEIAMQAAKEGLVNLTQLLAGK